jgi:flagellin
MTVINSNIASLNAQAAIATNSRGLERSMQQLSTGKRINSAADDAAGLAISSKLTSQIRGLNQAVRNANDAISMLQTAEGATNEITNMLQRMRELAVQSANDTNMDDDRTALNTEYQQLVSEIDRIAATTLWNGETLIDGNAGSAGSVTFHVGSGYTSDNQISVTFNNFDTGSSAVMTTAMTTAITSQSAATSAIDYIDSSIASVNTERATFGASINRLQYTVDNLTNVSMNAAASRSRIEDADYSLTTTELAKRQIIQQAATAMLAQANQQPQAVLTLLK